MKQNRLSQMSDILQAAEREAKLVHTCRRIITSMQGDAMELHINTSCDCTLIPNKGSTLEKDILAVLQNYINDYESRDQEEENCQKIRDIVCAGEDEQADDKTGKKYILTEETKEIEGHILHRIQAIKDFGRIKAGDLGGWVEKEENLSHKGLCWVFDDAQVFGNAQVLDNARVIEQATVKDFAVVCNDAIIYGNAIIKDSAWIKEYVTVSGHAVAGHNCILGGHTQYCY